MLHTTKQQDRTIWLYKWVWILYICYKVMFSQWNLICCSLSSPACSICTHSKVTLLVNFHHVIHWHINVSIVEVDGMLISWTGTNRIKISSIYWSQSFSQVKCCLITMYRTGKGHCYYIQDYLQTSTPPWRLKDLPICMFLKFL